MDTFFYALLLISTGGILAPLLSKQFTIMKWLSISVIVAGCAVGSFNAGLRLLGSSSVSNFSLPWLHLFSFSLVIDPLTAFFLLPVFIVPSLAAIYSLHYFRDPKRATAVAANLFFYAALIISMALVLCAGNLITFALAWECMSLSSFFLVLYDDHNPDTRQAGYIYFLFTQAGALFIFAAFGFMYSATGNLGFHALGSMPEGIKLTALLLLLLGCGSKAGIMPLHSWLPHAHPAAPSHVSAVMSGVMIKMGIYGIIRFYILLHPSSALFGQIIIIAGLLSGILGVTYAQGKHNIKRLLAYSSIENMGIILLGLGIGMVGAASGNTVMAACGFAGGLLHVLNHSLFKSLLFLGAGAVIKQTGTANIDQLGGLIKKMPVTGRSFLIGSISISGLPPFNGFISEFLIYYGAFHGLALPGSLFLFSLLTITGLALIGGLAAACFTKVVGIVFLGEPRSTLAARASEAGWLMCLPQLLLAAGCLGIGIFPDIFVRATFRATALLPGTADFKPATFIPVITALSHTAVCFFMLFIALFFIRKLLYLGKEVTSSATWGCGFSQPTARMQYTGTSYADTLLAFFKPFIRVENTSSGIKTLFPGKTSYSSHVTDIAEQGLNMLLVRPSHFLVNKLRWIQHGNIQLYIGYIVLAVLVMLIFL